MALDPSLALQSQSPNPTNFVSSFLDLGQKKLNLQKSQATLQSDIARNAAETSRSQSAATVDAASVQPAIAQNAANSQSAQTASALAKYQLTGVQAQKASEIAQAFATDKDFTGGNTDGMLDKLNQAQTAMTQQFGIDPKVADATITALKYQAIHAPGSVVTSLQNMLKGNLGSSGQAGTMYPAPNTLNTGATVQPVASGNPALTGTPAGAAQGTPTPLTLPPGAQDQPATDQVGNPYRVQRDAHGNIVGTAGMPGAGAGGGPNVLPPNETPQTRDALQAERQTALQQVQNAGNLHQINREIYNIADSDVQTGKLGGLINKISSATGFQLGAGEAADYNTLGKMLARSNQQLAQGMGPHTNAGLEQTNAANGTTDYDKNTIKKIANLNDALVTGTQMYQKGLEAAIQQNGVFGKRQFDQAWGSVMDPDALRLKNAVDNGDKGQIQMIVKQAGGPGSAGAKKLLGKLGDLDALATTGQLRQ